MKYKQTAVEWLVEQLEQHHTKIDIKNTVVFQQAKEMERQQIIEAYDEGEAEWTSIPYKNSNDYYQQNYGL